MILWHCVSSKHKIRSSWTKLPTTGYHLNELISGFNCLCAPRVTLACSCPHSERLHTAAARPPSSREPGGIRQGKALHHASPTIPSRGASPIIQPSTIHLLAGAWLISQPSTINIHEAYPVYTKKVWLSFVSQP